MNHHRHSKHPPPPLATITMSTSTSSATATATTTTTTTTSSKKKFGKNLNKLIKQPTPPPITGLNSRSLYRSNSSNNGTSNLVLLSTKKKKKHGLDGSSSGGGGTTPSTTATATTATATTTTANEGNVMTSNGGNNNEVSISMTKTESGKRGISNSTPPVKLMYVMNNIVIEDDDHHNTNSSDMMKYGKSNSDTSGDGAPASIAWGGMSYMKKGKSTPKPQPQQQPQPQPQPQPQELKLGQHSSPIEDKVESSSSLHARDDIPDSNHSQKIDTLKNNNDYVNNINNKHSDDSSSSLNMKSLAKNQTKSHNYQNNNNNIEKEEKEEDQVEFMKKLAKEKAAKLRQEEENRIKAQKERAALRLKELEMKMAKKSSSTGSNGANASSSSSKRSLFDPSSSSSRTYSALLGSGNKNVSVSQNHRDVVQRQPQQQQQQQQQQQPQNLHPKQTQDQMNTTPLPPLSTIHLSSYDDRDRGMVRNVNAGPRMLFDPKSGSMVAVPPKDESTKNNGSSDRDKGGNGNSRNRKERNKSKSRKKDSENSLINGRGNEDSTDIKDSKSNKRNKSKKDKKRDEKRGLNGVQERRRKNSTSSATERNAKNNSVKKQPLKKDRLPRTKGVLYKRDENGKIVSADGCEGDQGYGAHSVPGGRVRNPKAYATHQKKLQEESENFTFTYQDFNDANVNQGYSNWHLQYSYHSGPSLHTELDSAPLKLNRSHFMRKKSPPRVNVESKDDETHSSFGVPSPLRVKGNDKLDLLTGMNDSPTLQATAAEWAPSQAALDLAAANANKAVKANNEPNSSEDFGEEKANTFKSTSLGVATESDEEIEESESIQYGLGFDPTKDMDAVIRSPDFTSSLDDEIESPKIPQLLFETKRSGPKSINPFATDMLLNSSPWGSNFASSEALGSLSNWGYSLTTEKKDGDNEISPSKSNANNLNAQPYLSLGAFNGDTNTWGSGGLTSFGSPNNKG